MIKNLEKSLKRYLKRKVKITLGLMISFLICGSVGYAEEERVIELPKLIDSSNGKINSVPSGYRDVIDGTIERETASNGRTHTTATFDYKEKVVINDSKDYGRIIEPINSTQIQNFNKGATFNISLNRLPFTLDFAPEPFLSDKETRVALQTSDSNSLTFNIKHNNLDALFNVVAYGEIGKAKLDILGGNLLINFEKPGYSWEGGGYIGTKTFNNKVFEAYSGGYITVDNQNTHIKGAGVGFDLSSSSMASIKTGEFLLDDSYIGAFINGATLNIDANNITMNSKMFNENEENYYASAVLTATSNSYRGSEIKLKADELISLNGRTKAILNIGKNNINLSGNNIYISGNEAWDIYDWSDTSSWGKEEGTKGYDNKLPSDDKEHLNSVVYNDGGNIDITGENINIISHNGESDKLKDKQRYVALHTKGEGKINLTGSTSILSEGGYGLYSESYGEINSSGASLSITADTGINSVDNGKVTLNSSSTNIIAKDDGIRTGNHGSVTIDTTNKEKENKENSVLVSSDLRALTTATEKGENGGKIDITSSSINLVGNKVKDEGIYTGTNNMNLKVQSVVFGYRGDINLNGDINIISENNESLGDENRIYAGVQSRGGSTINLNGKTHISSKDGVALYATDLREIDGTETTNPNRAQSTIDLSAVGNHTLLGDIVAGKNSTITISGSGNYIGKREDATKEIEILAANGGTVNLDLTDGILVGRVDDYYEANEKGEQGNSTIDDSVFRNDKFYKEISSGGTANLIMDEKTTWIAKGQSYVSNINYDIDKKLKTGDNFGLIDMSTEEGTSVNIKNLGSNGTFKVKLNSDIAQGKNVDSDMIYIQNITSDNTVIDVIAEDAIHLNAGEKLRFATVGEKTDSNYNNNVVFNVLDVKEKGIKNVSFTVGNEKYDKANETTNELYNGKNTEVGKPGNEFVDKEYGNGTNHYLTKNEDTDEGGDSNVNDGGLTIIEMGKSTYANAVYMDNLNKRLGDMSFATGDEGIWVRMRNDRVGEDEHYRLHNYMTQLGYDKKYTMDNGDEHRGIAFEYGRGDLDFKQLNGGELKSDKYILTLYDTRVRNNGVYTDYTLRGGAIATDFTSYGRQTGNEVNGSYKNMLLGAGVEGGKRFDINKNWYFEPQAQLQYTFIDSTDYTTNQSTKVELDSIHSLIGRAGFRLGHDYYNENGKDNTIYVKADINHEFLGDQNIKAIDNTGSLDKTYKNDGTWYDIGIGGAKNITPDFNVYMDVEKQFGDNRDSNSWQFNVGFRYRFNELKDLNPVVMLRDFSLRADNYFDFDKSTLKPEGKKVIKKVSEELTKEKAKGTLKIEGHTDWTGTREYNQKLSERRAKSVEEELRKNITTDRIKYETVGYGEDRPIADNTTKEGRAKNRRVDIKFEGVGER